MHKQGKLSEAEEAYRKAIALKHDYPKAYDNLGLALEHQWKLPEAEQAARKAIELNPDNHEAYTNLSAALGKQGKLREAEEACRQAIQLKEDYAPAYGNLGNALSGQNKLPEAITAYQKAVELQPNDAKLHYSLGVGLHERGSFAASLASLRHAQKLGSQNPKLPLLIQHVEQYVVLDAKLPKIMNGESLPGSPAERIFLAKMCQLTSRQLHATAARFYSEAFALEPKLAEPKVGTDLVTQSPLFTPRLRPRRLWLAAARARIPPTWNLQNISDFAPELSAGSEGDPKRPGSAAARRGARKQRS